MKKRFSFIIIIICTILLPNLASAYELNVEEEFLRYNGSVPDAIENANNPNSIKTSDKGYLESYYNDYNEDVIINGETISPQGNNDSYIIKYDTAGRINWWKKISGDKSDLIEELFEVNDGYIAAIRSDSSILEGITNIGNDDIIFIKYDKNGDILWKKNWGGSSNEDVRYSKMIDDNNIRIVLSTSSTDIEGINSGIVVLNLDSKGNITVKNSWGGSKTEYFSEVTLKDDSHILYGYSNSTDIEGFTNKGDRDIVILKYDKDWNLENQTSWGGNKEDTINNIKETSEGYIVHGYTYSTDIEGLTNKGQRDIIILKYDKNFKLEWQTSWGGDKNEYTSSLIELSDGYIALGYTSSSDIEGFANKGESDALILKYDKNGNLLWHQLFGGNNSDYFENFYETNNGYIALGYSYSTDIDGIPNNGWTDAIIVKYDKDGNEIWHNSYRTSSSDNIYSNEIVCNNNEECYIVKAEDDTIEGLTPKGANDIVIIKYDPSGNIEWKKMYGGSKEEYSSYAYISLTGNVMIFGESYSKDIEELKTQDNPCYFLISYDSQGNLVSEKVVDIYFKISRLENTSINNENKIGIGNFFNDKNNSIDSYIASYDENGKEIWKKSYNGKGTDYLERIFATPDNSFIVVGTTNSTDISGLELKGETDILIAKYDYNGNLLWQKTYGGSKTEEFINCIQTSDGGVFFELGTNSQDIEGITPKYQKEYLLIKYDGEGNLVYQQNAFYGAYAFGIKEYSYNVTGDGGFILGHNIVDINFNATSPTDYIRGAYLIVEKYDKNGKLEWEYEYKNASELNIVDIISELEDGRYQTLSVKVTSLMALFNCSGYDYFNINIDIDYELTQEETSNGTYSVKQEGNKGVITLNPDKGYTLDKITITNSKGEEIEYYEENDNYYFLLYDDAKVNVTYKEDISNPNTITFLKLGFIAIIIFAIYNLFISKRIKLQRYSR